METDIDPFAEATNHIANVLKILLDVDVPRRTLTSEEFRDVFYGMLTAFVQLKKLPGAIEVYNRVYDECRTEQLRRKAMQNE